MHRLDVLRGFCILAERPMNFSNAEGERRITNRSPCPHGFKKLVFGHQLAAMLKQIFEYSKRFRWQSDLFFATPYTGVAAV
jgi:hypothetical protein